MGIDHILCSRIILLSQIGDQSSPLRGNFFLQAWVPINLFLKFSLHAYFWKKLNLMLLIFENIIREMILSLTSLVPLSHSSNSCFNFIVFCYVLKFIERTLEMGTLLELEYCFMFFIPLFYHFNMPYLLLDSHIILSQYQEDPYYLPWIPYGLYFCTDKDRTLLHRHNYIINSVNNCLVIFMNSTS